jgi:hypothetical protein
MATLVELLMKTFPIEFEPAEAAIAEPTHMGKLEMRTFPESIVYPVGKFRLKLPLGAPVKVT